MWQCLKIVRLLYLCWKCNRLIFLDLNDLFLDIIRSIFAVFFSQLTNTFRKLAALLSRTSTVLLKKTAAHQKTNQQSKQRNETDFPTHDFPSWNRYSSDIIPYFIWGVFVFYKRIQTPAILRINSYFFYRDSFPQNTDFSPLAFKIKRLQPIPILKYRKTKPDRTWFIL